MSSKSIGNSLKVIFSVSAVAAGGYLLWRGRQIRLGQALVGLGTLSALFFTATGGSSAKTKPDEKKSEAKSILNKVDPVVTSLIKGASKEGFTDELIERFWKAEDYALHHKVCAASAKGVDNASWQTTMKALAKGVPELPAWLLGREGHEVALKYFTTEEIRVSYLDLPDSWPAMIADLLVPGETHRMSLEQLYPFLPDPAALQYTVKCYAEECFFNTFIPNQPKNGDQKRQAFIEDMTWLEENDRIQHEPCLEELINKPPYLSLDSTPEHAAAAKKCVEELKSELAPYEDNWIDKSDIKNLNHWFNPSLIHSFLHDDWKPIELAAIANDISPLSFFCLNEKQRGWVLKAADAEKKEQLKKVL